MPEQPTLIHLCVQLEHYKNTVYDKPYLVSCSHSISIPCGRIFHSS